jgi:adenylate kinase
MKSRVIVVGLPGVGKTTVLNEFQKIAEKENIPLKRLNYGTVMMEIGKTIIKNRDDIRRKPLALQSKLQKKAAQMIAREAGKGLLLVDTHMIVKTPSGYLPGLPSHVVLTIKPDLIVLIEASIEEIASRRATDASRRRDTPLLKEVENEIQLSRAMASACATLTGAPVAILNNPAGGQSEVAKQLFDLIKG